MFELTYDQYAEQLRGYLENLNGHQIRGVVEHVAKLAESQPVEKVMVNVAKLAERVSAGRRRGN
jgi:hypothetical protein